jgi:hypothetical protein
MLLYDQCIITDIQEEIKKFLGFNENVSTTNQNLWETAKAIQREKFIAMSSYTKNTQRSK